LQDPQWLLHASYQWHCVQTVCRCHSLSTHNMLHLKARYQTHSLVSTREVSAWNTLKSIFILRHLQHVARTIKPINSSRLQAYFLKGTQGVKRSAPNWAVLRECGYKALQFYLSRAAIKFYNGMPFSNCLHFKAG